jgi:lysophospholipase L1-like esterase
MKIVQIILITLTALSGCTKKSDMALTNMSSDTSKTTTSPSAGLITYLALGDSYTIGQSVTPDNSYPVQLAGLLSTQAYSIGPPTIIATTGWTTADLMAAIAGDTNVTGKKYDFVTLLIGVNDQFQGISQDVYRANFIQLLHTAISFAKNDSTRVFVLSIPDYGVTPFAAGRESTIGPEIDQFNAINKTESGKAGVNYLDITPISKEAADDTSLLAPDGLHPSGKMYKLWMAKLEPMVAARLKKN